MRLKSITRIMQGFKLTNIIATEKFSRVLRQDTTGYKLTDGQTGRQKVGLLYGALLQANVILIMTLFKE